MEYLARSFFTASQTNRLKPLPLQKIPEYEQLSHLLEKTTNLFKHQLSNRRVRVKVEMPALDQKSKALVKLSHIMNEKVGIDKRLVQAFHTW